jgi:hypothetical protein
MANEITVSSASDLIAREVLAGEVLRLAASRGASILNHPAVAMVTGAAGSNVVRVPVVGLDGYDLLTAHTAGSAKANSALSDGKVDVTLAGYSKVYALDEVAAFAAQGRLGMSAFAQDMLYSAQQTMISLLATAGAGAAASVGTSGSNLTLEIFQQAKETLAVAAASGPMVALLAPRQWADIEADILANGTAVITPDVAGAISNGLDDYKGRLFGVDVFVSNRVPSANSDADRAGCMFVRGGVVGGMAPFVDSRNVVADFGPLGRLAIEDWASSMLTKYVSQAIMGASLGIEANICAIITDK